MKKLILGSIAILTLLLFSACSGEDEKNDPSLLEVKDSGRLTALEKTTFDWGDINIEGGKVEQVFKLKNVGEEDLIIKSGSTTCMCTTAIVEAQDGAKSPAFGMHEGYMWGYPISPGEEFSVRVVFDPMAHGPNGVGPIERSVFLITSSKPNAEFAEKLPQSGDETVTELRVSGNVLYKADYDKKMGGDSPDEAQKGYRDVSVREFQAMMGSKDFFLLDVHIPEQEHIEQTDAFIPYNELEANSDQLPQDKSTPIVVYCRTGSMSMEAAQTLLDLGYTNVTNLQGGRNALIELTNPTTPASHTTVNPHS